MAGLQCVLDEKTCLDISGAGTSAASSFACRRGIPGENPSQSTSDTNQHRWSQLGAHTQEPEPGEESRGHFQRSVLLFGLVLCDYYSGYQQGLSFFNSEITKYGWRFVFSAVQPGLLFESLSVFVGRVFLSRKGVQFEASFF